MSEQREGLSGATRNIIKIGATGLAAATLWAGFSVFKEREFDLEGRFTQNLHAQPLQGPWGMKAIPDRYPTGTGGDEEIHAWCASQPGESAKTTLVKAFVEIEDDGSAQKWDKEEYPYRHPACDDGEVNADDAGRFNPYRYDYDQYQRPGTYYEGGYYQSRKGPVTISDINKGHFVLSVTCKDYETVVDDYRYVQDLQPVCSDRQVTESDKELVSGLAEHH